MPTRVKLSDLEEALMWISDSSSFDNAAYVDRASGKVWWTGDMMEGASDEVPPDYLDDGERYAQLPDRHELGLGSGLPLRFVEEQLPSALDRAHAIFSRKGAYGRFKSLLEAEGKLQAWYDFENAAEREALATWAEGEGFDVRPG
jgi:hypothetical protein